LLCLAPRNVTFALPTLSAPGVGLDQLTKRGERLWIELNVLTATPCVPLISVRRKITFRTRDGSVSIAGLNVPVIVELLRE
jgi:hypothetical protein